MWDNKPLVFNKCAWYSVSYVMWVVCWCVMCHIPGPYVVCEVCQWCVMYPLSPSCVVCCMWCVWCVGCVCVLWHGG